jgi:hypothetical protein
MLYAVASTGALSTGTSSAAGLTGAAWERDLLERLADELAEVIETADRLDLPLAQTSADAKVATAWLAKLPPLIDARRRPEIDPGDRVAVAGRPGIYYVRTVDDDLATVVTLSPPAYPVTVDVADLTIIPDSEETR